MTTTPDPAATAQLLASASSRRDEHDHGRPGCRACRWFEVVIAQLDDVSYRVTLAGRTTLPGETDRIRTEDISSAHAVVDLLAMHEGARTYLPWTSRKALHEAAELDSRLGDALDDFDLIHGE